MKGSDSFLRKVKWPALRAASGPSATGATIRLRAFVVAALVALALPSSPGIAQLATGGTVTGGFKFPDYDRTSSALKSLLIGRTARQQPDGTVHVTALRVETYAYPKPAARELETLVLAPTCNFDMNRRLASSPGPVRVERADGQFTITGEGFELKQSESVFTISNNVHAVLRPSNPDAMLLKSRP